MSGMRPRFITFTGADDATSIREMGLLASRWPVEFGILFSRSRMGKARYPSRDWMTRLLQEKPGHMRLSAHLCGEDAGEVVESGSSSITEILAHFDRIQVNVAKQIELDPVHAFRKSISAIAGRDIPIILQTRAEIPEDDRFHWLFDASGGRGIEPGSWPAPPRDPSVRFGFAGGIGPDNIHRVLANLPLVRDSWIDMETRIRNARDEFDIDLCRIVCERTLERLEILP